MDLKHIRFETSIRSDGWGDGHYGAARAGRSHNGIDALAGVGLRFVSPVAGFVSKIGICYAGDSRYRYVEVESRGQSRPLFWRFLYLDPAVAMGEIIQRDRTVLGTVQNLRDRYPKDGEKGEMRSHVHIECFELWDGERKYRDPLTGG